MRFVMKIIQQTGKYYVSIVIKCANDSFSKVENVARVPYLVFAFFLFYFHRHHRGTRPASRHRAVDNQRTQPSEFHHQLLRIPILTFDLLTYVCRTIFSDNDST
jgi:hypothetical protein